MEVRKAAIVNDIGIISVTGSHNPLSIYVPPYQKELLFNLVSSAGLWQLGVANLLFKFFSHFSSSFFCGRRHGLQICRGQF